MEFMTEYIVYNKIYISLNFYILRQTLFQFNITTNFEIDRNEKFYMISSFFYYLILGNKITIHDFIKHFPCKTFFVNKVFEKLKILKKILENTLELKYFDKFC